MLLVPLAFDKVYWVLSAVIIPPPAVLMSPFGKPLDWIFPPTMCNKRTVSTVSVGISVSPPCPKSVNKFPKASFSGIIEEKNESIVATGTLKIHGESNKVEVTGSLEKTKNNVIINATFVIELTDYKIKIPKVVMYNIAEEIEVTVNAELKKI